MLKKILASISVLASLAIVIFALSYTGAEGFNWFAGFKTSNIVYRDSIALSTYAVIVVGIGLSVAGTALQSLTKNKLASSYSLGTITGSTFAIILVRFIIAPNSPLISILLTLLITLTFSVLIVLLSSGSKVNKSRIIIVGLILSVFFSSLNYMLRFALHLETEILGFLSIESLSISWLSFKICVPLILAGVVGMLLISKTLWIYETYDEKSKALGINIAKLKWVVSILSMIITACSVILVGPISFVGIVVPHITNMIFRKSSLTYRMLMNIPISILILCVTLIIFRAYYSKGVSINAIISIMASPIVIFHILRRARD